MSWKKIVGRTLATLAVLSIITLVGGFFYLRSSGFREFAIRKIVEEANKTTGGHAQIRGIALDLSTLRAHLYGVVLRGTEPDDAPPLLQVDELTVGLKIQSAFHHKVSLTELLIERPVVHLQVDRKGDSNLPQAPPTPSSKQTNVFDLAVGHVAVSNGEINYNDRKTPLEADLYDLGTNINFDAFRTEYRGSVSYDNGHFQYGAYAPLPHSLNAQFAATPSRFALESVVMKVASSPLTFHADITNYSDPEVSGDYDLRVHTQDLAAMSPAVKLAGDVSLTGRLHYHRQKNRSLLRSIMFDGQVLSESLSARASSGRIEVRKLQGKYQLADGSFYAHDVEAELLGGRITANAGIQNLDATPSSRIHTTMRGVSLRAIEAAVGTPALKQIAVSGMLDGTAEAFWTGNVKNARVRSDLTVRAEKNAHGDSATPVPIDGVIHASYDGTNNVLSVHQTNLHSLSMSLTAEGQLSKRSDLKLHAAAGDLHQLAALVSAFHPTPAAIAVSGSATLNAAVQGSLQNPQITGQLTTQDLGVQGSEWKSAGFSFQANSSRVAVSKGVLVNTHRGTASFDANVGLRDWSYLPSDPVQAKLSLRQMSVVDLEHLANLQYPVSGELSAWLSVNGSQLNPIGSGSVEIENARAYDEPIQSLVLKFHAEGGSVVSTLNVGADAGSANANLTYTPKTKAYSLRVDAPSIVLQKLHAVQVKHLAVNGTLSATASGQGTLADPQLSAAVQIPKLEVQQKSIADLKAELRIANKQADLTLDSQAAQAAVSARGHVNLVNDYEADASIDTAAIPLDVLLAAYASGVPEGFKGQTEFHATVKGPLKDKNKLEAHLTIPRLDASYQSLQIGAASPIRVDYLDSVVTLRPVEIRGTGTSIHLQGSIPIAGAAVPSITAQGSVDASIIRILVPDMKSSGIVALDIRASGSATNPQLQGQVHLQNLALSMPDAPLSVDKLNATFDVSRQRVQVSNMTGEIGGGQVSVGGSITYRPSPQFNLALQGKSVRLRYPQGLRSLLDSNLTWVGNVQASTLRGRVLIDSISFTPDFDLSKFSDQFSGNSVAPAQTSFADGIGLQIALQSKENLSANSSQVSIEGTADLRVTGTAANPVITGRTDLTSGELFYRSVRYQLQRGVISFENPNQTSPVLNVSVTTTVEQYNLTLNLRGPFDSLTTAYTSDPPLATADIINLIAMGKTTAESAAASQSTDSMIASQALSQVGSGVQKLAGISSLEIDPSSSGNGQNPSTRVGIQQRVSKNFLFTFSTDVSQPGQEIVQGDYQINKRWSVSVQRDQVGGVSIDGRFHTRF